MSSTSTACPSVPLSSILLAALLLGACGVPPATETSVVAGSPTATEAAIVEPAVAAPAEAASIELEEATALRVRPNQITYAVRVANRSGVGVTGLTLRLELPAGATLRKILTHPGESGAEGDNTAVTWTVAEIPAWSILGPFAYLMELEGDPGPVAVEAEWVTPSAGSAGTSIIVIDEATQSEVTMQMSAGGLTDIPGTGMRYFVPLGDRGQVTVARVDAEPPAGTAEGLAWMGTYEVAKEKPGSLILVVPLLRPARPYSLLRVFVDHGGGVFLEQPVMGTITGDGLHASFAADGSSLYSIGLKEEYLGDRMVDPVIMKTRELGQLESEVIDTGGDVRRVLDEIDALLGALLGGFSGSGDQQGDGEGGMSKASAFAWAIQMDWMANDDDKDGLNNGMELILGTDPGDPDSDDDGKDDWFWAHTDGGPLDVLSSSIVGTDCPPPFRCLWDAESGEMFALADSALPEAIAGLLTVGAPYSRRGQGQEPQIASVGPGRLAREGERLDANNLRGVVGVVEGGVLLFIPGGQQVQVVYGVGQQISAEATAPPGLASPTLPPTVAFPTFTPAPTNTPADTQGPTISNPVTDPNPVYTGGTSAVAADVSDPSGVSSVQVRWRYLGEVNWRETLAMTPVRKAGTRYAGAIPASAGFPQVGTVVFEVVSADGLGNTGTLTGTISVVIP